MIVDELPPEMEPKEDTTEGSFRNFLKTLHGGPEGLAENANIQEIIALQRLWEGAAGKNQEAPYIITNLGDEHPVPRGAMWLDKRPETHPHWWYGTSTPAVDTLKLSVPYTTVGNPSKKVHGLIDMLIEELGHSYEDLGMTQPEKEAKFDEYMVQRKKFGDTVYDRKDAHEHGVHSIITPYLRYIYAVHGGVIPENIKHRIEAGDTTMLQEAQEWIDKEKDALRLYKYEHPKF